MEKVEYQPFCAVMVMRSGFNRLLSSIRQQYSRLRSVLLVAIAVLICWASLGVPGAIAGLNDDRFEGDIFALFAGNGSLVPPKVTLAEALQRDRPTLLVFYIDDSTDCKQFSTVVSQLQGFYGRVTDFLAIRVDSLPVKASYAPNEAGYYYKGFVPQTVLFDAKGKVVLNEVGNISFEQIDDKFRQLFDLLPRNESVELKRRPINEINTELVKE